ncbi:hypothetical protein CKO42_10640 [Lamprobacter modestohalophilus]|uniref:Uncharacterized protein n=1 Tax=Lamprobacter modestohalophilus TaxID=1064514 RepID=A0A9X0W8E5_9GAMM|nr:hypothetical protein [Lamprobacter modestohalophilus]
MIDACELDRIEQKDILTTINQGEDMIAAATLLAKHFAKRSGRDFARIQAALLLTGAAREDLFLDALSGVIESQSN